MLLPQKTILNAVYGETTQSIKRFTSLSRSFREYFQAEEAEFFTAPGRTELIGNHTDHNGGRVLAASINMDTIAAARPVNTHTIRIVSEGYPGEICIDLNALDSVPKGKGTLSLAAGLMKGAIELGFKTGGFEAYLSTTVIPAAGVSSSASFEMLLCAVINYFFNEHQMTCTDYARIGQYAENHYWEKDSGLMDQMACAVGGTVLLDFSDGVHYKKLDFSFSEMGYDLIIINTGKGHADLSQEYSAIPREMKLAATALGAGVLNELTPDDFLKHLPGLSDKLKNDRAILRSLHYFTENERVSNAAAAITGRDWKRLLNLICESGNSSWKWLQNCYSLSDWKDQKPALILALSELFLNRIQDGCCRIHGGGFAGVTACIVPCEKTNEYIDYISQFIDAREIYPMQIRDAGAIHLPHEQ